MYSIANFKVKTQQLFREQFIVVLCAIKASDMYATE